MILQIPLEKGGNDHNGFTKAAVLDHSSAPRRDQGVHQHWCQEAEGYQNHAVPHSCGPPSSGVSGVQLVMEGSSSWFTHPQTQADGLPGSVNEHTQTEGPPEDPPPALSRVHSGSGWVGGAPSGRSSLCVLLGEKGAPW